MNLLRAKCWGRYLALFAMMVQLAFAFGHIHGKQFHVDGRLVLAAKSFIAQKSPVFIQTSHDLAAISHENCKPHHHNDPDEENISNCWMLTVASSLVLPDIAGIPWQLHSFYSPRSINNAALVSTLAILPYQARAPPFAPIV